MSPMTKAPVTPPVFRPASISKHSAASESVAGRRTPNPPPAYRPAAIQRQTAPPPFRPGTSSSQAVPPAYRPATIQRQTPPPVHRPAPFQRPATPLVYRPTPIQGQTLPPVCSPPQIQRRTATAPFPPAPIPRQLASPAWRPIAAPAPPINASSQAAIRPANGRAPVRPSPVPTPPTIAPPRPATSVSGTPHPGRAAVPPARQTAAVVQRVMARRGYGSKYAKHARAMRAGGKIGGRNIATVYFTVKSTGDSHYRTIASEGFHSEKRLYDWLEEDHKADYTVHWLYTELAPCGPEVHNCRARVGAWFPGVPVYYSFIYPDLDEVSSDDEDDKTKKLPNRDRLARMIEVKRTKAKRRRKRSINILKRLNNQPTLEGLTAGDFRGGLTAPYSPQWVDPSLDPGYTF